MNLRGITILPREDSVMGKGLKKLIKGPCPLEDMATAWELSKGHDANFSKFFRKHTIRLGTRGPLFHDLQTKETTKRTAKKFLTNVVGQIRNR